MMLYICSAFTVQEYRNKGLALNLLKEAIDRITKHRKFELFAWPYSKEGENLIERLGKELNLKILLKK